MTISKVEPDLRQIIQTLRDGDLETAKNRTVELIECACRMSGPMYREEVIQRGPQQEKPTYNSAAGKLRILTKDLRDVSFTMRRGTQTDALEMAERASGRLPGFRKGRTDIVCIAPPGRPLPVDQGRAWLVTGPTLLGTTSQPDASALFPFVVSRPPLSGARRSRRAPAA